MYSLLIADVIRSYSDTHADVIILAEPTYGACCVDDLAAVAVGCDLLVHYGHSCLVPVTQSKIPALYVFVEIQFDVSRLVSAIVKNFDSSSCLAIAGTVQFLAAVHAAKIELGNLGFDVMVPQSKPLSAGEVLGCTAPSVGKGKKVDALVFVADGRFHLEAFMIANPGVPAFRFDPFIGKLVLEEYDHAGMKSVRKNMILRARKAKTWGVILGTLGRQGSTRVLDRILEKMDDNELDYTIVLMSEISPTRIELFEDSVDAWVQIACPRLSIDWGEGFKRPLLTTFEFDVCMGYIKGWWEREIRSAVKGMDGGCGSCDCKEDLNGGDYPMDYYAQDGGDWNGSYMKKKVNATVANGTVCCSFKGSRDNQSLKEVQP